MSEIQDRMVAAVAIGESAADGHAEVWRRFDEGAPRTIRSKLREMHERGVIRGRMEIDGRRRTRWVYWREA